MKPTGEPAGMLSPLLPELRTAPGSGASVSGAVFNLSTSIVGAGIMSIPATLKVLGVLPALLLIAAVAFLSDASVEFLMRYAGATAAVSYSGTMGESFGRAGSVILQLSVMLTNAGVLITYLIIIGDVLSGNQSEGSVHRGLLEEWFGEHWWTARWVVLLIALVVVMLPLVHLRRVDRNDPVTHPLASAPDWAAEMLSPLLPEPHPAAGSGASLSSAVFNLSTSIVGAGIMSIPATLRVLGVLPALLLIAAVAFLSDASVEFLLRYTGGGSSYSGIMGESFGRAGSAALQICVALTNVGALVMYLIIIGDVISGNQSEGTVHSGLLQEWFGEHWWTARGVALLVALVVIMLPLLLLRRVDSLRFTSAVSILLAVVFVFISSGMAINALFQGTTKTPRLLPDFIHLSSVFELFTAVPVIVVAFTFHFNVHPIRAELSSTSDMTMAVRISLILCSAIYAAVGFFGYLLFGDATMADILSNFDQNSGSHIGAALNDVVRLSYALHLVLVFPLLNFSLRLNIDELLFPKSRPLASDTVRFVSLTVLLMGFLYLAAIVIPNIWTLFQFFGSTTAVCLSLIFPGAIVLRDVHGIAKRRDKLLAGTMIVLAVVTSTIAIASNVSSLFGSRA